MKIIYKLSLLTLCAMNCFLTVAYADMSIEKEIIRYVPIGDSYTIGSGASLKESWPMQLANKLQQNGIPLVVIVNPARSGWTTRDALDHEIPIFVKSKPDFATLLIGTNDWSQGIDAEEFRVNLQQLMDQMLAVLPDKNSLLVLTNPDFSITPYGKNYEVKYQKNITEGLRVFNDIIKSEAEARELFVFDLFSLTSEMKKNIPLFISQDNIHPSQLGYKLWMESIYPIVEEKLLMNIVFPFFI